jgi:hypothetical protein
MGHSRLKERLLTSDNIEDVIGHLSLVISKNLNINAND